MVTADKVAWSFSLSGFSMDACGVIRLRDIDKGLEAGIHDRQLSGGPVQHLSDAGHSFQQRAQADRHDFGNRTFVATVQ
jgi:hypothetical protein